MLGVQVPPGLPFFRSVVDVRVTGGCRMDRIKIIAEKVKQFLAGSKVELKKVTWPTPKQTLASTSIVIIVVIIVSAFLGIVDFGLTKIVKLVLG
jgi:preprotein translocase subunit SecE